MSTVRGAPTTAKGRGLVLAALVLLLLTSAAQAYETPARLNEVARVYSQGAGDIRCPSQTEWDAYHGSAFAWGSTNLREDNATARATNPPRSRRG